MNSQDAPRNEALRQRFAFIEQKLKDKDYSSAETDLLALMEELAAINDSGWPLRHCYEKIAECYWFMGRLEDSLAYCGKVVDSHGAVKSIDPAGELSSEKHGERAIEPSLIAFSTNRAMLAHSTRKIPEAAMFYEESLNLLEDFIGPEHSYTVKVRSLYADLLRLAGRQADALLQGVAPRDVTINDWLNSRLLEMLSGSPPPPSEAGKQNRAGGAAVNEAALDEESRSFSLTRSEARAIFDSNKFTAEGAVRNGHHHYAERLLEVNIKLLELFAVGGAALASTYSRLAQTKSALKKYDDAVENAMHAYELKRELLGDQDLSVARAANALAEIYYLLSDYDKAEPFARKCVEINERAGVEDSPDFASGLHNLATLYHVQRKYDHADAAYKKCLEIKRRMFGADHPETQRVMNSYAELLKQMMPQPQSEPKDANLITGSWKIAGASSKLKMGAVTACDICGTDFSSGDKCPKCGYDPAFGF